jgi:hypothetical protein
LSTLLNYIIEVYVNMRMNYRNYILLIIMYLLYINEYYLYKYYSISYNNYRVIIINILAIIIDLIINYSGKITKIDMELLDR